jgi:2-(1,2-epoxy-1,2-dihydrophenyl)acetyl-CoA isomerase
MIFNTLKFTLNNGIGVLNLNRPDHGNAMNLEMTEELLKIAKFCINEEYLRVLLISSEGEKFCVGGD